MLKNKAQMTLKRMIDADKICTNQFFQRNLRPLLFSGQKFFLPTHLRHQLAGLLNVV